MTGLLQLREIRPVREMTLDELWNVAASLGAIRVWQFERGRDYKVEIKWKRHTGSEIEAVGRHTEIGCAISNAIIEARELGAGEG